MILGAVFEIEMILKQVAFLRTFWGRGLLFVYLGVPLLKAVVVKEYHELSDDAPAAPASSPDGANPSAMMSSDQSAIFEAIVGASLTVNGMLNLSMACSSETPGSKKDEGASAAAGLASALMMDTPAPV